MKNCAIVLGVLLMASYAMAAPVVTAGSHNVLANTAGQVVSVGITGAQDMAATNVAVAIDSLTAGPTITALDMLSGVYAGNNDGGAISFSDPRLWLGSVLTNTGTLGAGHADGTLFSITIDTTGLSSGTYALKVTGIYVPDYQLTVGTELLDAQANTMQASFFDGTITVLPEPATLTLLGLGLVGTLLRRRS